jgi:uncharacterized membrane protein
MNIAEFLSLIVTIAIMGTFSFFSGHFGVKLTETGIIIKEGKLTSGGAVTLFLYILTIGFLLYLINTIIYETLLIYLSSLNLLAMSSVSFIIILIIISILAVIIYSRRHRPRKHKI